MVFSFNNDQVNLQQWINLTREGFGGNTLILIQLSDMKFEDNDVTRGMQFWKLVKLYFAHVRIKFFHLIWWIKDMHL